MDVPIEIPTIIPAKSSNCPLITVLINTYNYGQFVEEAIDSVLSQDFRLDQIEIIVVDDGSTDDTPERIKKYGDRVRYLYKTNGGQASALNLGLSQARGDIIALLDADDLFLPGRLARIADAFHQDPALVMVYHKYLEWNMETDERHESTLGLVSGDARIAPEQFSKYDTYPTSAIALRRTSLSPFLPIPERIRMLADCYIVQLIPLMGPILAIPEPLVVYRIHGKNHFFADPAEKVLQKRKGRLRELQILFNSMREWLKDKSYSTKKIPVLFFVMRWYQYEKSEEFRLFSPGRLSYFWFLIKENYLFRTRQTWKLTLFNYAWAFVALAVGFKNSASMYSSRARAMRAMERLFKTASRL